jgi:dienelactone hydrolase
MNSESDDATGTILPASDLPKHDGWNRYRQCAMVMTLARQRHTMKWAIVLILFASACSTTTSTGATTHSVGKAVPVASTEPRSSADTTFSAATTATESPTTGSPTTTHLTTVTLPRPDGPSAVGVTPSGFPDTEVFYPAVASTGVGSHHYIDARWATAAGLDPAQMDRVLSSAQQDATPEQTTSPRPIVVIMPGWRSVIAFATSLAEELASHGYVVLMQQTDVVTEATHESSTAEDRINRTALLRHLLDFIHGRSFANLVGPIDLDRIAVGGHSYAGSIAFDANITDRRVAAVFDLDGSVRAAQTRPIPTRPSLIVTTVNDATTFDPLLSDFATRSPNIVAVGITNALHVDVTDAASIPSTLGTSVYSTLLGSIGSAGTIETSTIVLRFLDTALGADRRVPTTDELLHGLSQVTTDPFKLGPPPTG